MGIAELARPISSTRSASASLAGRVSVLAVLAIGYAFLFRARAWGQFFDESDNFLGGHLIARGAVLYRDYFSHHMPLPYYLAAIPSILGVSDLVGYRVFTSLAILGLWAFILLRFRGRVPSVALYLLVLTIAFGMPAFDGYMLLAETIEAYCLLILVLYLVAFPELDWRPADRLVVAPAVFSAVMCTLMSVYPLLAFGGYYLYRRVRQGRARGILPLVKAEAPFVAMIAVPFAAALLLLIATGTLRTFWQDAFVFNQVYYSKYALASNPLRILRSVVRSDYWLARGNLNPLTWRNLDGFALVSNVITFTLLARKRGLGLALGYAAIAALSRGRGAPFHDQAYYVISFFSASYAITWAGQSLIALARRWSWMASGREKARLAGASVGLGCFLLLALAFYGNLWVALPRHVSDSYRFDDSDVVAAITTPDDPIWVVPLDFYAYLATDRVPATRYAFYLPWLADSPAINAGILQDLAVSRPPVIIFPPHYWIGRYENGEMQVFALDHYGKAMRDQVLTDYVPADATDPRLQGVLLRRDRADVLRQRLRDAGILGRAGPAGATASSGAKVTHG